MNSQTSPTTQKGCGQLQWKEEIDPTFDSCKLVEAEGAFCCKRNYD